MNIKWLKLAAIAALLFIGVEACNGSGGGSGGTPPPTSNPISGAISFNLPQTSSAAAEAITSYTMQPGSSTNLAIMLSNKVANISNLQLEISSSNPSIMMVDVSGAVKYAIKNSSKDGNSSVCTLNSSSNASSGCTLKISSLNEGTANIIITVIGSYANQNIVIAPLSVTVTKKSILGSLSFGSSSVEVTSGSTNTVELNLVDSSAVKDLNVQLSSNSTSVVTITPGACSMGSDEHRACTITLNGLTNGNAVITASATGYSTVSVPVTVVNAVVSGSIAFNNTPQVNVTKGGNASVNLVLNGSSGVLDAPIKLAIAPTTTGLTLSKNTCSMSTTNSTCSIIVLANADISGDPHVTLKATGPNGYNAEVPVIVTSQVQAGTLSFSPTTVKLNAKDSSRQDITLSLNNSSGVSGLHVTVTSKNPGISGLMNLNGNKVSSVDCIFSSTANTCDFVVYGVATGSTMINAVVVSGSKVNPTITNSVDIDVTNVTSHGTVEFSTSNVTMTPSQTSMQLLSLNLTGDDITPGNEVTVTLHSANPSTVTLGTTTCKVSSVSTSCPLSLTAGSSNGNTQIIVDSIVSTDGYAYHTPSNATIQVSSQIQTGTKLVFIGSLEHNGSTNNLSVQGLNHSLKLATYMLNLYPAQDVEAVYPSFDINDKDQGTNDLSSVQAITYYSMYQTLSSPQELQVNKLNPDPDKSCAKTTSCYFIKSIMTANSGKTFVFSMPNANIDAAMKQLQPLYNNFSYTKIDSSSKVGCNVILTVNQNGVVTTETKSDGITPSATNPITLPIASNLTNINGLILNTSVTPSNGKSKAIIHGSLSLTYSPKNTSNLNKNETIYLVRHVEKTGRNGNTSGGDAGSYRCMGEYRALGIPATIRAIIQENSGVTQPDYLYAPNPNSGSYSRATTSISPYAVYYDINERVTPEAIHHDGGLLYPFLINSDHGGYKNPGSFNDKVVLISWESVNVGKFVESLLTDFTDSTSGGREGIQKSGSLGGGFGDFDKVVRIHIDNNYNLTIATFNEGFDFDAANLGNLECPQW